MNFLVQVLWLFNLENLHDFDVKLMLIPSQTVQSTEQLIGSVTPPLLSHQPLITLPEGLCCITLLTYVVFYFDACTHPTQNFHYK